MSEENSANFDVQDTWTDIASRPTIDPSVLAMGHVFDVLDNPRRRYVLYALSNSEDGTLRELARNIVAWERDIHETDVDEQARDRVYLSLYHAHIPKLVEEGVVEFDESEETLRPGPHAEQVFAVLESAGGATDWDQQTHAERGCAEASIDGETK